MVILADVDTVLPLIGGQKIINAHKSVVTKTHVTLADADPVIKLGILTDKSYSLILLNKHYRAAPHSCTIGTF